MSEWMNIGLILPTITMVGEQKDEGKDKETDGGIDKGKDEGIDKDI